MADAREVFDAEVKEAMERLRDSLDRMVEIATDIAAIWAGMKQGIESGIAEEAPEEPYIEVFDVYGTTRRVDTRDRVTVFTAEDLESYEAALRVIARRARYPHGDVEWRIEKRFVRRGTNANRTN